MPIRNIMLSDNICNVEDQIEFNLYTSGIHYLTGEINQFNTTPLIQWIISENTNPTPKEYLTLYINSIGGDLYDSFAVIDIMKSSKIPIKTIGLGSLMSAAFMIFVSGERGGRTLAKNTSIMCHQFSTSYEGKEHDIKASSLLPTKARSTISKHQSVRHGLLNKRCSTLSRTALIWMSVQLSVNYFHHQMFGYLLRSVSI